MNKIVIGIPTFKRGDMLTKLLRSIDNLIIDHGWIEEVIIVVVDNDIERSAEKSVDSFVFFRNSDIKIRYENCIQRGLASVRNKIFEIALSLNPDYIVCVDDDEYVSKNWLLELVTSITENNAEIVVGPVTPDFEVSVPAYVEKWFRPHNLANNQEIKFFASGNFVIDVNFVRNHNLRFDERFNFTGSEDTYFGLTALKYGAKIIWCKNSVAVENIPVARTKISWLMERKFRESNVFTSILIMERRYLEMAKKLVVSFLYLVISLPALVLYFFPNRLRYDGLMKLAEACGGISAFFKFKFEGY